MKTPTRSIGKFSFRSIVLVIALISVVLVLAITSQAQADEPIERLSPVEQLTQLRGISTTEAEERIAWQDRASKLYDTLEERIPDDHGGVWIGRDDDRVKVGIVNSKKPAIQPVIAGRVDEFSLESAVDYIPVERSMAELDLAIEALADMPGFYDEQNKEWSIQLSIMPSRNKVMLGLPPGHIELTAKQKKFVAEAKKQYGSMLAFERYPGKLVTSACNNSWYCDSPLRGGVRINFFGSNQACTSGFIVRGKATGRHYVLTAGHCSRIGPTGITGESGYSRTPQRIYRNTYWPCNRKLLPSGWCRCNDNANRQLELSWLGLFNQWAWFRWLCRAELSGAVASRHIHW